MNNHSARHKAKNHGRRAPPKNKNAVAAPADPGKRTRILDAAVKVFAAEGFYNAKVSQIAQAAGVADGTIYLYFKSKDDLLINLFEDRMELVNANLRAALASASTAVERLKSVVRLHLKLIEEHRH